MQGADGDMGEGVVDDGEEYGDLEMTEAEYMQLVAEEQARLAQQQEEDDEEGLTEEQLEQLRQAFDACDADKDGALSKVELETLLMSIGAQLDDDIVEKLMQAADSNADGKIQFEEFVQAVAGSF